MIKWRKKPATIAFFSQSHTDYNRNNEEIVAVTSSRISTVYNIIIFSIGQSQRNFRELAVENNLLQSVASTAVSLIKTYTKCGYPFASNVNQLNHVGERGSHYNIMLQVK